MAVKTGIQEVVQSNFVMQRNTRSHSDAVGRDVPKGAPFRACKVFHESHA